MFMFTLIEITPSNETSLKLDYLFVKEASGNDWKRRYQLSYIFKNISIIKQGDLSDFEYFKITRNQKAPFELTSKKYLLLLNGNPVTSIYVIERSKNISDITVATLPKYQRKGYAKKAIKMVEEKIFANPDILFTTITDITKEKISSKIATDLGYILFEETNIFVKSNPNLEEKITHLL